MGPGTPPSSAGVFPPLIIQSEMRGSVFGRHPLPRHRCGRCIIDAQDSTGERCRFAASHSWRLTRFHHGTADEDEDEDEITSHHSLPEQDSLWHLSLKHTHTHAHTHMHTHTYAHTHTHMHLHRTHTYVMLCKPHTHTHTHTHTSLCDAMV